MANILGWIKSKLKNKSPSYVEVPQHVYVDRLTYEIIKSNDEFIIEAVGVDPIYIRTDYKKKIHTIIK